MTTTKAHKDLTGVDLHEPKGITGATSNQVYRADGAGSGSWQTIVIPSGLFVITTALFTSSGTWTKPANLFSATIHCIGSGSTGNTDATTSFATGGSAAFGSHCSATGGGSGTGSAPTGGVGSSGDLNFTGGSGEKSAVDGGSVTGGRGAGPWASYGAGSNQTASSGNAAISGAGGGYARKQKATASLGSTENVTIGTAGANNGLVLIEQYISL